MKQRIFLVLSLCLLIVGGGTSYANGVENINQQIKREAPKKEVKKVAKVKTVSKVPTKAVTLKHKGVTIHANNGKYYKSTAGKYQLVSPPFGLRVKVIPAKHSIFNFNNLAYLFAAGVIYKQLSNNEYEIVQPEVGMIVPELPDYNVSEVAIGNKIYLEFDNVLYMQVPTVNGLQYEVVGTLDL